MGNKKKCVWKRRGYLFVATLLGASSFSSYAKAGTDYNQFNSVTTELSNDGSQQQTKKISVTVVDETVLQGIGANVVQKGTTNGNITDIDGRFSLDVPPNAILEISYIGYIAQEVKVGSKSTFQIILVEDTQNLDEVVVVGYGVQKKVNMTGAVAAINSESLANRPVTNASTALQGMLPGVTVVQNSGQPGRNIQKRAE